MKYVTKETWQATALTAVVCMFVQPLPIYILLAALIALNLLALVAQALAWVLARLV